MFTRDSSKVIGILKELTLGIDAETWIKGLKCGRKYMQYIKANYDVTSEGAQRKQVARANLKKIFYKNETNFKFDNKIWCSTL